MLKRYFLFAFFNYYPRGGWSDFQGSFDTFTEAHTAGEIAGQKFDDWEIVDSTTGKVIS